MYASGATEMQLRLLLLQLLLLLSRIEVLEPCDAIVVH